MFPLLLNGRLLFYDSSIPAHLKLQQANRETWLAWINAPETSAEGRREFTDKLRRSDLAIESLASRAIGLRPLDVELVTVARLALKHRTVLGFRYPTQACPAMLPVALECSRGIDEQAKPPYLVWFDQGRQSLQSVKNWNNGIGLVGDNLSVVSFTTGQDDYGQREVEEGSLIELRYASQIPNAIVDLKPAIAVVHFLRRPDPEALRRIVAEARQTRGALVVVYSPGALLIAEDLRDLGVPAWIVPRASLTSLSQFQPSGARLIGLGDAEVRRERLLAESGWGLKGLAVSDNQLNWSLVALWRTLATLSSVSAAGDDPRLDRALAHLYGLLVAAETQSAPVPISDSVAIRTRWAIPFGRRLELGRQALADLSNEHPGLLPEIEFVEQLFHIVSTRLREGTVGKPASILQLVVKALQFKRPLLVVTCTEVAAKATAGFVNQQLESMGLPSEEGWDVVSAAELVSPNASFAFRRAGFTGKTTEMACLPLCRHEDHAFLYGLPISRTVVTFLYQSQVALYKRILQRIVADDLARASVDCSSLLRSWGLTNPSGSGAALDQSNIAASETPPFNVGEIQPAVRLSDVASRVAAGMRDEIGSEGLARDLEARGSVQEVTSVVGSSRVSNSTVDALTIRLDGDLQVCSSANHRVFVVRVGERDVSPVLTREVEVGDRLIAVSGSVEYSLTGRLLQELADLPDWSSQVRYRFLWVETLQEWKKRTQSNSADFLRELKKRGSAIRTEEAVRFWLDGDVVIGPRDSQDIYRTAEICGSKKLARYADVVVSSVEELREVHQRVKRAVIEAALRGTYHQIESGGRMSMSVDAEERIERFVRDVSIHVVLGVEGPVRIESKRLNVLSPRA